MDVDEAQVEAEVTPTPDEQVHCALAAQFTPFPFTHDARNTIFARRSLMSDELVFDLLLEQASIASPQSLFPPDSPETLLQLLDAIAKCPWDSLKKSCLHFYLLSYVSPGVAAKHATVCALPPQFVHLAHACFLLDCGSLDDLARAVALLSDARIVQDLSSKILHTLSLAPQPTSSRLIRTYVRTAQPVLEAYEDLAIYLRALMECSLADAWSFQRTFSETTPIRNQLVRTILDGCLIPPKPSVLPHLLSLPLTSFEFSLLQSYALSPPQELTPAAHSILQDLITVRLLHSGKYSDAIRLSRAFDSLNTKSRTGNTVALHKAAEERQQMMRDVLAVVPEVQRRQLEVELNEEDADGENAALGASWMSVGSDVNMSWENLGASGSAKPRDRTISGTRSGRLEGSPAPTLPMRGSGANTPFGLFSSPANSAQKRKMSAQANNNPFSTHTPTKSNPPVFPIIPTPGLATSTAHGTPSILSGFRPTRFGFGTPPLRQPQATPNGVPPTSMPRLGAVLNARNTFESESSRGTSLFGKKPQSESSGAFAASSAHGAGDRKAYRGEQSGLQPVIAEPTLEDDDRDHNISEDVVMIDSDDTDGFVVRGRRRTSFRPPTQTVGGKAETKGSPETIITNGVSPHPTTLFGRQRNASQKTDHAQRRSSSKPKILPGGFTSMELIGDAAIPSEPPSEPITYDDPLPHKEHLPRPARTRSRRNNDPKVEPQRLKIPGALFEDEDPEAEAGERQDSLLPLPETPVRGSRRTRASRASTATAESDEDDAPRASLRRSSRLSSGLSPEPPSPQKAGKKTGSKRTAKAAVVDASGRSTRKRKSVNE